MVQLIKFLRQICDTSLRNMADIVLFQRVVLSADLFKNCSRYVAEISHEFKRDVAMDILGISLMYLFFKLERGRIGKWLQIFRIIFAISFFLSLTFSYNIKPKLFNFKSSIE